MLGAASVSPLYGKISDVTGTFYWLSFPKPGLFLKIDPSRGYIFTGRKPILFSVIIVFLIGSALCGAAQNMTWLIVCRAIQGIGGGGILQLVQITISDIVSLQE